MIIVSESEISLSTIDTLLKSDGDIQEFLSKHIFVVVFLVGFHATSTTSDFQHFIIHKGRKEKSEVREREKCSKNTRRA